MRTPTLTTFVLLGVLIAGALLAGGLLFGTADPVRPGGGPDTSLAPPAAPTESSAALPRPEQPAADRAAVSFPTEPTFASFDEDGNPIEGPIRDGLVILVRSAAGTPCGDVRIVAKWRKGFGLYGRDVGRTDAAGRLATTVAHVEHFEGVEVEHPQLGELSYHDDFLPMAEDPRTVCVVVPDLAQLRVSVIDGRGGPVAGAEVKVSGGGVSAVPREHLLRGPERELVTDAEGRAEMFVPHGAHEVRAEAEDCTLPQTVWTNVATNGGDATLVLLRAEHRIDVTVHVTRPSASNAGVRVTGFSKQAPPRTPAMAGWASEGIWREFFVDRQSNEEFIVRAEPVPWRLVVSSEGCADAVVDLPVGQTEVHVALAPAPAKPPKARLVVTVFDPDGAPTFADIRVHETPDFVHGSDQGTNGKGRLELELEPKGRVCVSASRYGFARHVVGPFELTPGDHEIRLQLQRSSLVSGRVVDAAGNGVAARVRLHRPAGALRGLADGVPEILENTPTSDSLGVEDGVFRFADCGPGEHEIWAFPEHGLPAKKRVLPGVPATLVLGEGLGGLAQVRVTVRDAATLLPLPEVEVGCRADVGKWSLRTDAAGRCLFVARPGEIRVRGCRAGYAVHTSPPQVVGEGPVEIQLHLRPSPVLFVRVLDAAGRPVAGAEVSVLGEGDEPIDLIDDNGYYDGESLRTNQAGRADLRGAPAGALRLRIEHDGRTQDFDVPATAGRSGVFEVRL